MNPESCESRADAIRILKMVLVLPTDLDYEMVFLWAAHTHMRSVLPPSVCLYIAFDGPKSSGKTTATKCAVQLACKGKMIASTTPAALKRLCEGGATLGIDEVDAHARNDENLETILRVGNSWDAKAELVERVDGKHEIVEMNVGGPKAFNFRGEIDDALRSRCLIIGMPSSKDTNIIIDSLYLESILTPIKAWLERLIAVRLSESLDEEGGWSPSRVESIMRSEGFKNRVSQVEGTLGRNIQQAAILLMVSDIMNWNLDAAIKEAIESQPSGEQFELEKEIIAEFYLFKHSQAIDQGGEIEVSASELKENLNAVLKEKNVKPLGNPQWGFLKRECGWQEGINERKMSKNRGKRFLKFDGLVLKALGLGKSCIPTSTNSPSFPHWSQENLTRLRTIINESGLCYDEFVQAHPDLKLVLDYAKERGMIGTHPVDMGLVWNGGGL